MGLAAHRVQLGSVHAANHAETRENRGLSDAIGRHVTGRDDNSTANGTVSDVLQAVDVDRADARHWLLRRQRRGQENQRKVRAHYIILSQTYDVHLRVWSNAFLRRLSASRG